MLKESKKKKTEEPRTAAPDDNAKFVEECALDIDVATASMNNQGSSPEYHAQQLPAQSSQESSGRSEEKICADTSSIKPTMQGQLDI